MPSKVLELFGYPTWAHADWKTVVAGQHCPYLGKKCIKVRKSEPDLAIGTCTVRYSDDKSVVICPFRLTERRQVFTDALHLLTSHEPGNELHVIPEISVPGGHIDYFLASVKKGKVQDFVGVELQTLDTTGTVFPERQRFIQEHGLPVSAADVNSTKSFGMNWKMTAKTILVQLHHKIETFEGLGKHLLLVIQDHLLKYMTENFSFGHLANPARLGDPMHIHAYTLAPEGEALKMDLAARLSTDAQGIAKCLGLQASASIEIQQVVAALEAKLSPKTLLSPVAGVLPTPAPDTSTD